MKKVVIFGNKDTAQLAKFYFEQDSEYKPVAFCVTKEFLKEESFEGLPLVAFEDVQKQFSPRDHHFFAPMTQRKMGKMREGIYRAGKEKGYNFATYISSHATYYGTPVGENTFIFEDNTIQPFTRIGNNVVLWSGNHIGHHSSIGDHVLLTSHVVISGHVVVEPYCFFGVNSTVRDAIRIAEGTLVAMGATVTKDTTPYSIIYGARSSTDPQKKSEEIM